MTSRNRILAALAHREPDRIPRDLGGTESSGMTAHALVRLQDVLGTRAVPKIFEPYQYVAHISDEWRRKFGIDTANLTPEPATWIRQCHPQGFEVLLPAAWREERDGAGATAVRRADGTVAARRPLGGYYFDPVNPPLRHLEEAAELEWHKSAIFSFDFPAFADESRESLRARARAMHAEGACVVFNLCCHFLAAGQLLRGFENFMIDLMVNEPMARRLLDLLLEGYCRRVDSLGPLLEDCVDVVLLNDDLGTQNGPMLAPAVYRQMIKPYQKALFARVKKAFGKPILFHSCGAVREFLPDLIEIGVDALNPVQYTAAGMDLAELKRDFGNDITFWGGGIDTQDVLNHKTPAEVADEVKRTVDILGPGGGFVFCQVHNVQPDVPPENILAMYAALDEYA